MRRYKYLPFPDLIVKKGQENKILFHLRKINFCLNKYTIKGEKRLIFIIMFMKKKYIYIYGMYFYIRVI